MKIMTKLKKYSTLSDWETAKSNLVYPSVGLVGEDSSICYMERPIMAGDVAYYDGYEVKTTPYSKWDISLGTPIGVVVVPEGFAPDRKVRIVALNDANSGNVTKWNNQIYYDIPKIPYIATTDNTSYSIQVTSNSGKLPSDKFDGELSYVDPVSRYSSNADLNYTPCIPSPYLNGGCNEYLKTDFNGNAAFCFSDTTSIDRLLNRNIVAASVAKRYTDGVSSTTWFLPEIGELLYIMPRFNVINETINKLGGAILPVDESRLYWSATQQSSGVWALNIRSGVVGVWNATDKLYVRPFAILN